MILRLFLIFLLFFLFFSLFAHAQPRILHSLSARFCQLFPLYVRDRSWVRFYSFHLTCCHLSAVVICWLICFFFVALLLVKQSQGVEDEGMILLTLNSFYFIFSYLLLLKEALLGSFPQFAIFRSAERFFSLAFVSSFDTMGRCFVCSPIFFLRICPRQLCRIGTQIQNEEKPLAIPRRIYCFPLCDAPFAIPRLPKIWDKIHSPSLELLYACVSFLQ